MTTIAKSLLVIVLTLIACVYSPTAQAQTLLTTTRIASGLASPLGLAHAPNDPTRLFVVQRAGLIRIVSLPGGAVQATPFLDLTSLVSLNWLEYGLLGMCFHPDYANNGYFYVNYTPLTAGIGDTIVVRYKVSAGNPNVADPASATTILRFSFGTRREHRAGCMNFGPDGYLYISTGDGGENDPDNAAQNLTLMRGKMLRIDVNGADAVPGTPDDDGFPADPNRNYQIPPTNPFAGHPSNAPELWAWGLRNPWRWSFDRETGDIYIGDVGQSQREEIDFMPAGVGGRNFGWRCTEGMICTSLSGCVCNDAAFTPPIFDYPRTVGVSVTGGYVYRGCAIPDLRGTYFYTDYQTSKTFSLRYANGVVSNATDRSSELAPGSGLSLSGVAALGEDANGEIYLASLNRGEIYKIVPRTTPAPSLTITLSPSGTTKCAGQTLTLTTAATSVGSIAQYRWRRGNTDLNDGGRVSGATTPTLTITNLQASDAATYTCRISNACMTATTTPAAIGITGGHCQPADIAYDDGQPLPPSGPCDAGISNTGVNEGDYNAFFQGFFDAAAWCDLADDQGNVLPPIGETGGGTNTGVNEGDYNSFFQFFFLGCP